MYYKKLIGALLLATGFCTPPAFSASTNPEFPDSKTYWYDVDGNGVMEWSANGGIRKFTSDFTGWQQVQSDATYIHNWLYFNSDNVVDFSGVNTLWLGRGSNVWEKAYTGASGISFNPIDLNNDGRTELMLRNVYNSGQIVAEALSVNAKGEIVKEKIDVLTPGQYAEELRNLNLSVGGDGVPGWDDMYGRPSPTDAKSMGSYSALDINGDGLPDFVDYDNGTYFLNTGDGRLVQNSFGGSTLFRDLNGDGICDYIVADSQTKTITAYIGNRGSDPTEVLLMSGLPFNSSIWTYDFDRDGDVDILIPFNGTENMNGFVVLMENLGEGKFRQHEHAVDINVKIGECADIDADGNYEVLAYRELSSRSREIVSYKVMGMNVATEAQVLKDGLSQPYYHMDYIYAADLDGTGRTRVFYETNSNSETEFFEPFSLARNQTPTAPSKPVLTFDDASGRLSIRWDAATDIESSVADLTYELRIGTTENGGEILCAHAKVDGKRLNLMPGSNGYNRFRVVDTKSWPVGRYYISVQAVDPGCLGSPFSAPAVFDKTQPSAQFSIVTGEDLSVFDPVTIYLPTIPASGDELIWDWDGATVLESASDRSEYKICFETGGEKIIKLRVRGTDGNLSVPYTRTLSVNPTKFTLATDGQPTPKLAFDMDGDGLYEILSKSELRLYESDGAGGYTPVKKIYNTNLSLLDNKMVCDVNRDGKPDILSYTTSSYNMASAKMLLNTGGKNMTATEEYTSWSPIMNYYEFVDVDNDGVNEMFGYSRYAKYSDNYTSYSMVYVNSFPVNQYDQLQTSPVAVYDYDGDGLLDFICRNSGKLYDVYHNNGDNTFSVTEQRYAGDTNCPVIDDMDGDGIPDFAYCNGGYGFGVSHYEEYAYIYFGNGKSIAIQCPDGNPFQYLCAVYDFDNNGMKDLLLSCGGKDVLVYLNPDYTYSLYVGDFNATENSVIYTDGNGMVRVNRDIVSHVRNTRPEAPGTPRATQNPRAVVIEWNAATDAETPQTGLRYNLSLKHKGAEGDGAYIISPLNEGKNGVRLPTTARLLNSTRFTIPIRSIAPGEYEVKVQAVDFQNEVSDFSDTYTFAVTEQAAVEMPLSAFMGRDVTIKFVSNVPAGGIDYGEGAKVVSTDAFGSVVRWNTPGNKIVSFGTAAKSDIYIHEMPKGEFSFPATVLRSSSVTPEIETEYASEWEVAEGDGEFAAIETAINVKYSVVNGKPVFRFGKAGKYSVRRTIRTDCGPLQFTASTTATDENARPEIDHIDIDGQTGKYAVHWTVPASVAAEVKSVNIYKEGARIDEYSLIGTTDAGEGVFVDEESMPSTMASRYCISYMLGYGESQLSTGHQSIHLMLNTAVNGWNLMWSRYDGRRTATYRIMRGTAANALEQIAEVSGNMASYTDATAPEGEVFYAVEPVFASATPVRHASGADARVQSNVVSTLRAQNGVLVESIKIAADREASLEAGDEDALYLTANIMPVNATFRRVNWVVKEGDDIAAIDANGILRSTSDKGGLVTVAAYATDGSNVSAQIDIMMIVTPDEDTFDKPILDPPGKHYVYNYTHHQTPNSMSESVFYEDYRVDVRIDEEKGEVYFLNLIPNHKELTIKNAWIKGYFIEDETLVYIPDGQLIDYDPVRKLNVRTSTSVRPGNGSGEVNGTLLSYNKEYKSFSMTDDYQREYLGSYIDDPIQCGSAYLGEFAFPRELRCFGELGEYGVKIPEDGIIEDYTMYYTTTGNQEKSRKVQIIDKGWNLYIRGFHDLTGDEWIELDCLKIGEYSQYNNTVCGDKRFHHIFGSSKKTMSSDYYKYSINTRWLN